MRALLAAVFACVALGLSSCSTLGALNDAVYSGNALRVLAYARTTPMTTTATGSAVRTIDLALYIAARKGDIAMMKELVKNGANPKIPDILEVAAQFDQLAAATYLMEQGADPNAPPAWGGMQTPFDTAVKSRRTEIVKLMSGRAASSAPVAVAPPSYPSLHAAIYARDLAGVKQLVESGADLNKRTSFGPLSAPLPQAVLKGSPEIVSYLVSKGAGQQLDALEYAAVQRRPEMIDALLAAGVVPSSEMNARHTPGYSLIVDAMNRRPARSAPGNLDDDAYARLRAAAAPLPEKKEPVSDVDAPARRGAERPDDFALVVGIEDYQNVPKADFGARDARTVRKHLEALGFPARNIISLEGAQATGSKLRGYLEEWLPLNVKPTSTLFVYYSGHGAPDTKTGDAYLVPWDGDPKFLKSTALPLKKLYSDLAKTKAKRVIVALDACFSGAGGRSVLAQGARPLVAKMADMAPAEGNLTVLAAASGDEITGTLQDQSHGLFTYYLLKALSAHPQASAQALFDDLKPHVQDDARRDNREQTPVLSGAGPGPLLP